MPETQGLLSRSASEPQSHNEDRCGADSRIIPHKGKATQEPRVVTKKSKLDLGGKMKRMRARQFVARARSLPTRTILTPLTRQSRTLDTTPPNTPDTPFRTRRTYASSGAMAAPLGVKPVFKTRGKREIASRNIIKKTILEARIRGTPPSPLPAPHPKVDGRPRYPLSSGLHPVPRTPHGRATAWAASLAKGKGGLTNAGATPESGWPSAVHPWLRPSPSPSLSPWACKGLNGRPGQGVGCSDGLPGAIRLGKIAPRPGDLIMASPAQAIGGH